MIIIIFFFAHWYLSLFSQSFFHHRYAAHGMFSMNRFWQKFFHVFAFITQGSSYLSAYAYGALHRMHHAYTDTDKDPHSPRFDDTAYSMMMRTRKFYNDIDLGRIEVEDRFVKDLPKWRTFDKIASSRISRVLWSFAYIGFYLLFATHWWMYLLLPIHFLMSPVHGVTTSFLIDQILVLNGTKLMLFTQSFFCLISSILSS